MNEGWLILGGMAVVVAVFVEVAVRLIGDPTQTLLFRLGRGLNTAIKALFRR